MCPPDDELAPELPRLARTAVEAYVRRGVRIALPEHPPTALCEPAPCFVSIRKISGALRGCMGTINPARRTLFEEVVGNAISAATLDPRFAPVADNELDTLLYSVDVLSEAEPAGIDDLNPKIYGVIVEDSSGMRRGLLLPDIVGIETATRQVELAARKAGIPLGEPLRLSRFQVRRFHE